MRLQHEDSIEHFIRTCYRAILNREPDPEGLQSARRLLMAGGSETDWLRSLIQSEEFVQQFRIATGIFTSDILQDERFRLMYEKCREYTIASIERTYALYEALNYLVQRQVPGDIVECGARRGGSCMFSAYTLLEQGQAHRSIYLYDTFSGMTEPTVQDVRFDGASAQELWLQANGAENRSSWWDCSAEEVRHNLLSTGYPASRVVLVPGRVEQTLLQVVPEQIALLRLDTDWYESTLAELRHLYPRLQRGGVLLIDDYGWWRGSRTATEDYFAENGILMLLCRIDGCGARMGIKLEK